MRLGILCTMLNGFGKKGFYNSQELGLGRQLKKDGHQVVIYKGVPAKDLHEKKTEVTEEGIRIVYIPMKGIGVHGYLDTRIISRDLDGLFCFADNQLFLPHVMRFCKKNHIRFVPIFGTITSVYKSFRGQLSNWLFRTFVLPRYRRMRVLAKTASICRELKDAGLRWVKVTPAGIDFSLLRHDFSDQDRQSLRREHGFLDEDVVLFSVARMEIDKRPYDMVKILNRVRDKKRFKLLLIGKGPLRGLVEETIAKTGLKDRVTLIESVPYEEMWKYYRMADYFLNLNKEEIFGMAIMEAVYYCVPVAAIRAPGPSSTLRNMKGHFLCEDDEEVAAAICGEYPARSDLLASSVKAVKRYSWERCAHAFEKLV